MIKNLATPQGDITVAYIHLHLHLYHISLGDTAATALHLLLFLFPFLFIKTEKIQHDQTISDLGPILRA